MRVELTYFKPNGKYYSSGTYETTREHLFEVWEEVYIKMMSVDLPQISGNSWFVLVRVPDHPHDHPHLILPPVAQQTRNSG